MATVLPLLEEKPSLPSSTFVMTSGYSLVFVGSGDVPVAVLGELLPVRSKEEAAVNEDGREPEHPGAQRFPALDVHIA